MGLFTCYNGKEIKCCSVSQQRNFSKLLKKFTKCIHHLMKGMINDKYNQLGEVLSQQSHKIFVSHYAKSLTMPILHQDCDCYCSEFHIDPNHLLQVQLSYFIGFKCSSLLLTMDAKAYISKQTSRQQFSKCLLFVTAEGQTEQKISGYFKLGIHCSQGRAVWEIRTCTKGSRQ